MKRTMLLTVSFILVSLSYSFSQEITPSSNILYVDKSASGDASGDSWINAVPELADALQWAREHASEELWSEDDPLQIWVAKGVYNPAYPVGDDPDPSADPRSKSFVLVKNVQVYGGFEGTETLLDERKWKRHPSELSGDLDGNDDENIFSDNAYHVVIAAGELGSAALDGFSIMGGYADGEYDEVNGQDVGHYRGGGIYIVESLPKLSNLSVRNNYAEEGGGGMMLEGVFDPAGALRLYNVSFISNTAEGNGGAIFCLADLEIWNGVMMGNVGERGGAVYVSNLLATTKLTLVNTVIAGNDATGASYAGGIYNNGSTIDIVNSTLSGNGEGAIYNLGLVTVKNSIINQTPYAPQNLPETSITNSIVQWRTTDNGSNLVGTTPPGFVNAPSYTAAPFTNGDYRLLLTSPVLDRGSDASYPGSLTDDVDPAGKPRRWGAGIDMGAYEGGYDPLPVTLISFEARAAENTTLLSWVTAAETGASHFEIQRSFDGRDFEAIGTVSAKGESARAVRYQFADPTIHALALRRYYRLKMLDLDGTSDLSTIISVEGDRTRDTAARLYPNPAKGGTVVLTTVSGAVNTRVEVADLLGRVMPVPVAVLRDGAYELKTGSLPAGVYLVRVRDGSGVGPALKLLIE